MEDFWEVALLVLTFFGSIAVAVVVLARLRARVKAEQEDSDAPQIPATASRRQRRVLEQLSTPPDIPTVMDLVREEIAELGIRDIPGSEELAETVALKVFRRDMREGCDLGSCEYRIAAGVEPAKATEDEVTLFCPECSEPGANGDDAALTE